MSRPKVIFRDDPVIWTIRVVQPDGQPVDANALPTVTIKKLVDDEWQDLADPVVVVRKDVGEYDCTYQPVDPNAESDQYGVDEAVQIDVGDGLKWYYGSWEYTIVSDETGGGSRDVEVTVQDTDTNIISGATVNVLNENQNPLGFSATTKTNGIAKFNLDDGNYYFQISQIVGYETHVPEAFTVTANNTSDTLTLVPLPEEEVPEVPEDIPIDSSGIKRVKTKHMEIEAFDPRIMQTVRDREQVPPTFCEVPFCVGTPVRRCRCS